MELRVLIHIMLSYTTNGLNEFRKDLRFGPITGKGYTVVVIDTGVDLTNPHPIFGGDKNNNGFSDRVELVVNNDLWRDPREKPYKPPQSLQDRTGHGTRVASAILAVAPEVNIIGAQSLVSSATDRIINWSVANKDKYNIVGINLSQVILTNTMDDFKNPINLGRFNYQSLKTASQVGITPVAAGGNFYQSFKQPGLASPAAYDFVLAAMHTNSNGNRKATNLNLSAQRRNDAIAAPGTAIPTIQIGGNQVLSTGSSLAAPFVTASAALLQGVAEKYLGRKLTFLELEQVINQTADPIGTTGYKEINVYKAADLIWKNDLDVDPPTPILNTVNVSFNNNVTKYGFGGVNSPLLSPTDGVTFSDSLIRLNNNFSGARVGIQNNPTITVKPDTLLSFEFKSLKRSQGEITGIGFDNDFTLWNNPTNFFSLESINQLWSKTLIDDYQYTGTNTWQKFKIPVGEHFTGTFNYLTFLNDQGSSEFKNIQLHNL